MEFWIRGKKYVTQGSEKVESVKEAPVEEQPILRCQECAGPVVYLSIPDFEGWTHDYELEGRLHSSTVDDATVLEEIRRTLECHMADHEVKVVAGSFDGTRDKFSKRGPHSVNSIKAIDRFAAHYYADITHEGENWYEAKLREQTRKGCGCTTCQERAAFT